MVHSNNRKEVVMLERREKDVHIISGISPLAQDYPENRFLG